MSPSGGSQGRAAPAPDGDFLANAFAVALPKPLGAGTVISVKGVTIMRSKIIPPDADVVRTYDALREFEDAFFNAEFYFLLVVGRPGLSKSWEFEERCLPRKGSDGTEFSVAHYIKGNITPIKAYKLAYQHRNKLLIFDDGERFWADSCGRYLDP